MDIPNPDDSGHLYPQQRFRLSPHIRHIGAGKRQWPEMHSPKIHKMPGIGARLITRLENHFPHCISQTVEAFSCNPPCSGVEWLRCTLIVFRVIEPAPFLGSDLGQFLERCRRQIRRVETIPSSLANWGSLINDLVVPLGCRPRRCIPTPDSASFRST